MADQIRAANGGILQSAKAAKAAAKAVYYPLDPDLYAKTHPRGVRIGVREFLEFPTRFNLLRNLRCDDGQSYPSRPPGDLGPSELLESSDEENEKDDAEVQVVKPHHDMVGLRHRLSPPELDCYIRNLNALCKFAKAWGKAYIENKVLSHAQRREVTIVRGSNERVVKNFGELKEVWSSLKPDDLEKASKFGGSFHDDFAREHEWNVAMTRVMMQEYDWAFTDPEALGRAPAGNADLPDGFAEGSPKKDNISQLFATLKSDLVKKFNKIGRRKHGIEFSNRLREDEVMDLGRRTRRNQRGHFIRVNGE